MKIFKAYFPLKNFSFTSLTILCAFGKNSLSRDCAVGGTPLIYKNLLLPAISITHEFFSFSHYDIGK
ncbi:MAG: hypothetical protein ACYDIA_07615 [Candidatus Humimicrobiaceae bacterium]